MRYADPAHCPDCGAPLPAAPGACPRCGLPLDVPLASELLGTLRHADTLLVRLRAEGRPTSTATATREPATATKGTPETLPPPTAGTPTYARPRRRGLSGATVPQILLGLGALCLLVAAVTFLAVAWSWLGIGGRTAILVGLTLLAGALVVVLARRGLRVGAEALSVVTLGLVALDLAGSADAGWLGDLDDGATAAVCGVGAAVVGGVLLALTRRRPLVAPQVVVPIALLVSLAGWHGTTDRHALVGLVMTVVLVGVGYAAHRARLALLPLTAVVAGAVAWNTLFTAGLARAAWDGPSLRSLWLEYDAWPLLAAAALLLAPALLWPRLLVVAASAAATLLTALLLLPAADETRTTVVTACLFALAAWSAYALLVRAGSTRWARVAPAPLALAALVPALTAVELAGTAADRLTEAEPFTRDLADPLPAAWWTPTDGWLLVPLVAGVLLAAYAAVRVLTTDRRHDRAWPAAVALLGLAATLAVALAEVPPAYVALPLAALGAALALAPLGGWAPEPTGAVARVAGLVLLVLAVPAGLSSAAVTALVLAAVAATAAVRTLARTTRTTRTPRTTHTAGATRTDDAWAWSAALPAALGGLAWTLAHLLGSDPQWRGVVVLLVVGAVALALPRPPLETAAAVTGAVAAMGSVDASLGDPTVVAVHLTVAGALLVAHALLHPGRRPVAAPGGVLLAAATWVRLADLGVEEPEPYTLPSALVLVALGLWLLRRRPETSTYTALVPGLALATVPSLLWALADPVSLRAVLLGLACLGLVVAGARLRWSAPLLVGGVVGALLVLRELEPYAADLPPWVLIGAAGAVLTAVGVTWESRLRDLRHAAAYVGHLR